MSSARIALIRVNVVWLLAGEPTAAQRAQVLVSAGASSADMFGPSMDPAGVAGRRGCARRSQRRHHGLIGRDARGNAVEVSAAGVSSHRTLAGKTVASPTPAGPARLRGRLCQRGREDRAVTTIKPGQF